MFPDYLGPLLGVAVSSAFTPGPNNIMMTASGANFGYRRSLPHVLGIAIGFPLMFVAIALGLAGLFTLFPALSGVLRFIGASFMLYLAWKIATSGMVAADGGVPEPFKFWQGAAFQWVNPKAWVFALSTLATFAEPGKQMMAETFFIALLFVVISFLSASSWCLFGTAIGEILKTPMAFRIFNVSMALLLVGSLALLFY